MRVRGDLLHMRMRQRALAFQIKIDRTWSLKMATITPGPKWQKIGTKTRRLTKISPPECKLCFKVCV